MLWCCNCLSDLDVCDFSLPAVRPVVAELSSGLQVRAGSVLLCCSPVHRSLLQAAEMEGGTKFNSAFQALETHYKVNFLFLPENNSVDTTVPQAKLGIVTEKLRRHEEERPAFLNPDLKLKLRLLKAVCLLAVCPADIHAYPGVPGGPPQLRHAVGRHVQ